MIPLSESHLRFGLKFWIAHYNGGRPHMSLGPSIPNAPAITSVRPQPSSRHRRGDSMLSAANQFSAACIMNTRWQLLAPDLFLRTTGGLVGEVSALRSGCEV
jgi:hypothetical protein